MCGTLWCAWCPAATCGQEGGATLHPKGARMCAACALLCIWRIAKYWHLRLLWMQQYVSLNGVQQPYNQITLSQTLWNTQVLLDVLPAKVSAGLLRYHHVIPLYSLVITCKLCTLLGSDMHAWAEGVFGVSF